MKKVLLISGSNRNGNTNYILNEIKKNIENAEIILLSECNIEYCKGCLACHKTNKCFIKDDMKEIIEKIIEADFIIFGVPNYFDNVTGLFKNFLDRLHPAYKAELLKNKKVIYIFTAGGKVEGTREEMRKSVAGITKYLKWDVVKDYIYQVLNAKDIELQKEKVVEMIKEVSNIIGEN